MSSNAWTSVACNARLAARVRRMCSICTKYHCMAHPLVRPECRCFIIIWALTFGICKKFHSNRLTPESAPVSACQPVHFREIGPRIKKNGRLSRLSEEGGVRADAGPSDAGILRRTTRLRGRSSHQSRIGRCGYGGQSLAPALRRRVECLGQGSTRSTDAQADLHRSHSKAEGRAGGNSNGLEGSI